MRNDECTHVTDDTFEACSNPGPLPRIATDTTQYQIAAAKEKHKKNEDYSKSNDLYKEF